MYDEILFAILEYINDLKQTASYWNKELFQQQAYSLWAAKEIYFRLAKNETYSPAYLVEDFANKMDDYACKRKETSFMFSIAHDVAIDILDLIYCTM